MQRAEDRLGFWHSSTFTAAKRISDSDASLVLHQAWHSD